MVSVQLPVLLNLACRLLVEVLVRVVGGWVEEGGG